MAHVTRKQIESIFFLGTVLYMLLVPVAWFVAEVRDLQIYLPFFALALVNSVSLFLMRTGRIGGETPLYLLVLSCSFSLVQTYFFFPASSGSVFHAVMAFGMFNAMVDVSVLLRLRPALTMLTVTAVATVVALASIPAFAGPVVAGPVVIIFLWKFLVFLRLRETQVVRDKTRQTEAFRATVVALSHEFNNVSAICQTLLRKIRAGAAPGVITGAEDLDMLERNLERMVKSIKALRKMQTYEEVVYVGDTKMVDLEGAKK